MSGWYSGFLNRSVEEEIENAKRHIELLRNMGCKVLFCELSYCIHGSMHTPLEIECFSKKRWIEYGKKLNEFSTFLKKPASISSSYRYYYTK